MKKRLLFYPLFALFLLLSFPSVFAQKLSQNHPATGEHPINLKKEGFDFVENKGQWIQEAKFKANIPDGAMFITDKGFVYNYASKEDFEKLDEHENGMPQKAVGINDIFHFHSYKVIFDGANPNPKYVNSEKRNNYNNYFIGNDKSKWASHVGIYGKITQQNIYNGIDVQVYSKKNNLKYDFVVNPNADVNQIALSFDGVTPELKPDGSLYIKTSVNEVTELAPYSYQIINGREVAVKSSFKFVNGKLSFEFPEGYDKSQQLIIDPVLVFVTYSGGTNNGSGNYSFTATYDALGNMYVGAECYEIGWPVTLGANTAYQATFAGAHDVGINKYNALGSALIYSTFYGGGNYELPHAMKVNDQNELVLVGSTESVDLPITSGCYDNSLNGSSDMFVAHFSADGSSLIGATFLGGSSNEPTQFMLTGTADMYTGFGYNNLSSQLSPMEITFDPTGNIWVVGNTNSTDIDIVGASSQNSYTVKKWICQGSSYIFGTQTLTTTGNYTQTFTTLSGCDSLVKLQLQVGPAIVDTVLKSICPGTTYQFGSQTLSVAGTYTHAFTSFTGCDSTVVLQLSIKPYITQSVSKAICPGTNYHFGTAVLTNAGTYVDTFHTLGCDSIATLTLSIKPYVVNTISANICAGKNYQFGSSVLHNAGVYVDTFSASGCDSIVTLSLTVNPYVRDTVQATSCFGSPYKFQNQSITAPGTYIDTVASLSSCDKIVVLQLTTGTNNKYTYYQSICQGSSYTFGSQTLTNPGDYTQTFTTSSCDSVVTIHLEYRPNIVNSITAFICPSGTYQFGSQILTTPGTYTNTFPTSACDSVVTLTLNISTPYNDTITVNTCQGTSYIFGADTILTEGTYTNVFVSSLGCDSTVTVHLHFLPYITTFLTDSVCNGGTYQFGSQALTTAGTYINIYNTAGCDSVVTLDLHIKSVDTLTLTENYCSGSNYYFSDTVINQPGTYYKTFISASGCDSTVRLILTGPWTNASTLSGGYDVVIFKLKPTCDSLLYSSYLGGTGDDSPTGMVFNNAGNLVISGITSSTNFPITSGTLHTTNQGGAYDGFVAIINTSYGNMVRSTYLGTNSTDQAVSVQVDQDDNVYVLGRTTGDYPITAGVYAGNTNGDIFIERMDPILSTSQMSTRMGNDQNTSRYFPSAFLVDICRNVYIAGFSAATGMPATANAYQTNSASFWFGVLEPDFTGLLYGSYFGANVSDHNHVGIMRMDPNGVVYHTMCNNTTTYPGTTPQSWAATKIGSGQDVLSFKFNFEATGVHSNFELAPGSNDTGCVPFTVAFTNTSNSATSYVWDFGDNSGISTLANPTHTYTDTGAFVVTLIAINPNTCITSDTSYDTIRVLKTTPPNISLSDTVLCQLESSMNLHVTVNNPTPNNLFQWGPAAGVISGGNQATVTVNPSSNTVYYVTVKDTIPGVCGYSTTDTIHIDLAPRVLNILTPDTVVCQGTVIQISAEGTPAYSYTWSPANGVSDTSILEPTITVNESAIYTITGKYYACPDTTVLYHVEMQAYPQLTLSDDKFVCQGTDVTLESSVTPFRNDYIYQWTPVTPNLTNPESANTHFIADTTITYTLNIQTPIGCSDKDSVTVTVFPGGFGSIVADTGYCPGNETTLWAAGGNTYLWTPSEGLSDPTSATPIADPHSTIQYTVYITDIHNCVDTEKVNVLVYSAAVISMPDSIDIYPGEQYHLEPNTNALYFTWFPPSGVNDVSSSNPLLSPQVRTRYFVTAKTEGGCEIKDSIDVIVKETVIDMPNAFAPNGGNNLFKPAKRGIATLKDFSIYDRWGNKVYTSTNIDNGWDGTYNGKPQPLGVYVYTIQAVTDTGRVFTQKGDVTLIR